jgi:hypothetical protein
MLVRDQRARIGGVYVPDCEAGERLGDKRNVTVVLRLVLDREGELMEGEVVDAKGRPGDRFNDWEEITPAVRRLARERGDP